MSFLSRIPILLVVALVAGQQPAGAALLVDLDATALPEGPLPVWRNNGSLGGNFTAEIDVPVVRTVSGVKGVVLDGVNDWYVGPATPAAVNGNGNRTVIAWLHNPAVDFEETVVGWGRRGGPDGTLSACFHGNHDIWGGFGGWGAADVGWTNSEAAGEWTCAAWVYDAAAGRVNLYTNGVLSTSKVVGSLNTFATSTSGGAIPFTLGTHCNSDGSRGPSIASLTLARVQIHDTAFAAAAVASAFQAGTPWFADGFKASSDVVHAGTPVTLSWVTSSALPVAIEPAVAIPAGAKSVTLMPLRTTKYTLTVAGSRRSTVTVIVQPGEPVASDLEKTLPQDTATSISLSASDPNPPAGGLVWEVVKPPVGGTLTGLAPDFIYTPAPGWTGVDTFTYRVSDGLHLSNTAKVTLRVNPPPSVPSGLSLSAGSLQTVAVEGSFAGHLIAVDPNFGESWTYQLVDGDGATHNSWFTISGSQLISRTSLAGKAGTFVSLRVRVTDSTGLAAERILRLPVVETPRTVVIHEVFHDPPSNARTEFLELHNPTAAVIDLSGWRFTEGIDFTFAPGTVIAAGGYLVLAMDPAAFLTEYGFAALGPYAGRLSSEGETLVLVDAAGQEKDRVTYGIGFPWPVAAGGAGASMELIHPSLDNDLGGSWRSSIVGLGSTELVYVPKAATGWKWRPGLSEASSPIGAWRLSGFVEDSTWTTFRAPIGFGDISSGAGALALNTTITGMSGKYRTLFARRTFTIPPGQVPQNLRLSYCQDDGIFIWINGRLITQRNISGTVTEPTISTTANNQTLEGLWYDDGLITNAASFLVEGTNTIAVQLINTTLSSSDVGFDLELKRPAADLVMQPTPGARNASHAENAPPQIRQVRHEPQQPRSSEPLKITAKATDPQGLASMTLTYQVVSPGNFIPARLPRTATQILADPYGTAPANPAFENPANWTSVVMLDDGRGADAVAGDDVFTATVPAQAHRTLVRYRIAATDLGGATVRVPYADDESLNFACFVYDGVPDYRASTASVDPAGAGKVWPKDLLRTLPVYHWLIRAEDMLALNAYQASEQMPNDGNDLVLAARRCEEWEGAFVHDGVVYDHVHVRLRGGNSRYGDNEGRFTRGKRHYKFRFNDGHHFQARDQAGRKYPQKWGSLAFNKMFGNKGGNGWGLPEEIGSALWSAFGVPAANTHWFHFRVIDGAAEAPDQYNGDFWGIQQVVEEYEGTFLEARGLAKGNLYKMSDWIWDSERQRRYQSPDMVRDGSEFNNIRDNLHGGQNEAWLKRHVDYDRWYRYSAVAEGIRHYDLFPYTDNLRHSLKNCAWYFAPTGADPTRGVCWWLPYDWDASFGPNWNNGWEHANNALYGWDMSTSDGMPYVDKPAMKLEHRNVLREFRDLLWREDQLLPLIDDRAAVISSISLADQDRWRNAPVAAGSANDDSLAYKVRDMKSFCFSGWTGGSGPNVGAGGRAAYLTTLADGPDNGLLPQTPSISYTGTAGHPINGIAFRTTPFADPQGASTFAAMAWRIGGVEDQASPAHDPDEDFILEAVPIWESGVLPRFAESLSVPAGALVPGRTYRARVRMCDQSGRWSHWSEPYQFTAAQADDLIDLQRNLMVTEIMYNPAPPAPASGVVQDLEYIELCNISQTLTLDLTNVAFTGGVDFAFAGSAVTRLGPGECVLLVKNLAAFEERHGAGKPVAGVWESFDNLSNSGEEIFIRYGAASVVRAFSYDDVAPWPTAADGGGSALALVDPVSAPDHSLATSWEAAAPTPGVVRLPGSFAAWLASAGGGDPAGDYAPGMSRAMAYALGADLAADPLRALPVLALVKDAQGTARLELRHRRRLDARDVGWRVETSDDLKVWSHDPAVLETVPPAIPNGDGTETVTVRVVPAVAGTAKRFVRLRVEVAE